MILISLSLIASGAALALATVFSVPVNRYRSLSQHIAQSDGLVQFGRIVLPLMGVLLAVWAVMSEEVILASLALGLVGVALVVMGLVPYGRSGRGDMVHDVAAVGSLLAVLCAEIVMAISSEDLMWLSIYGLIVVVHTVVALLYFLTPSDQKSFMLAGQLMFFGAFFFILLTRSFIHA